MARILKEHGKLHLLKGLITIEGSCSLTGAGLRAADFKNVPYMAFKGDYTAPSRLPAIGRCHQGAPAARRTTSSWTSRAAGRASTPARSGPTT